MMKIFSNAAVSQTLVLTDNGVFALILTYSKAITNSTSTSDPLILLIFIFALVAGFKGSIRPNPYIASASEIERPPEKNFGKGVIFGLILTLAIFVIWFVVVNHLLLILLSMALLFGTIIGSKLYATEYSSNGIDKINQKKYQSALIFTSIPAAVITLACIIIRICQ